MRKITRKLLLLMLTVLCTSAFAQVTPTGLWNRVGDVAVYTVYNDTDATDGVADGAQKIDGMTAVVGQGITFAFDGTMQNGTTYTINTAILNDTPTNTCTVRVSLWNKTDNVEVAVANSGTSYAMNTTNPAYNLIFAYTADATTNGKQLELRYIRTDDGAVSRNFEIDFAQLNTVTLSESYTPTSVAGNWSQILNGAGSQTFALVYTNDTDNGDGALDGAIRCNSVVVATNLGAAYTFDQPMVTGQTYSINTTVYNGNTSACPFTSLTLWNKTDNVQVASYCSAFSIGGTATGTYGFSIRNLKSFNYTATASDAGDVMELRYLYNATSTSVDLNIDNITLNGATNNCHITRWNGSSWDIVAPTANTTDAIITGNYNAAANIVAKTLTVSNNAAVTIPSGSNVTVVNDFTINPGSSFTLESNANLKQTNGPNTGNITVKRNSNALSRLDYSAWSSPVTNANQYLTTFSPNTDTSRFYTYDNTTNAYASISSPSTTSFAKGAGYLIRMPNTAVDAPATETFSGQFTGVPNVGNTTVSLAYVDAAHPYNLVGNPYPSTIDANLFLTANSVTNTYIGGTLYFWRKTNGASGTAYASYTTAGGVASGSSTIVPNGTIQVGQGFFVAATAAATIPGFFTNAMRTLDNTNQILKTKQTAEKSRVWLNLSNTNGAINQMLVAYIADATLSQDIYDGKYINDSATALTSNIEGGEYVIQGRPIFDATDVVPLNFKAATAGSYTIAKDNVDGVFATGQDIYLVDTATGTEINLQTDAYTFTAPAGTSNGRFSLKYQKTLGANDSTFNENNVTVYKNNGILTVSSSANTISNIKIYDIQGRLLTEQKNVNANLLTIKNWNATHQVLVVKVTAADNSVVTKKVIN